MSLFIALSSDDPFDRYGQRSDSEKLRDYPSRGADPDQWQLWRLRYLGIEINDAIEIAEKIEVCNTRAELSCSAQYPTKKMGQLQTNRDTDHQTACAF